MDLETRINGFTLLEKIGEGSFAIVYKAINTRNRRERAIKVEKKSDKTGKAGLAYHILGRERLFRNEGLVDLFNHPNSVRYYSEGETEDGRWYMEFELIKGIPLSKYGKCAQSEAKMFVKQLCGVVQHMHNNGILHNDIRGDNIMVVKEDKKEDKKENKMIKLIDSGIATMHKNGISLERGNISSREISAPESIREGELTKKTDFWGIGVAAYKMCVGEHPFPHQNKDDLAHIVLDKSEYKRLRKRIRASKDIPKELKPVIEKCLAYDPAKRYNNAAEMIRDLNTNTGTKKRRVMKAVGTTIFGVMVGVLLFAANRGTIDDVYEDAKSHYYSYSPRDRKIYRKPRVPKNNEKYMVCQDSESVDLAVARFQGKERYCQEFQDAKQLLDQAEYARAGYALDNVRKKQPDESGPGAALIEVYVELGFYREAQEAQKIYGQQFPDQNVEEVTRYAEIIKERKNWPTNPVDFRDQTVCEIDLIKKNYPECLLLVDAVEKTGETRRDAYTTILKKYPHSKVAKFVLGVK